MPNKDFLENYPLYRKYKSEFREYAKADQLPKPAINMYCDTCKSNQTFNMSNNYYEFLGFANTSVIGKSLRANYICSACGEFNRVFMLHFTKSSTRSGKLLIEKVGQYPAWKISMDKELEKILDNYSELYKKGLMCESQSYGIGAYAYYRRITENIIDELLNDITFLIEKDSDKTKYEAVLKEVKKN